RGAQGVHALLRVRQEGPEAHLQDGRRHVVRGGFGEEEGGRDRGRDAVRGAGEHLQGEVRGAVGGPPTTPSSKPLRKGACRWCSVEDLPMDAHVFSCIHPACMGMA
ncbi:hypothetical protein ACJX0J_018213, partial [Zea mays]